MFRYIFLFILIVHGLIHLMGFSKAFDFAEIKELTMPITRPLGFLWLMAFLLLGSAALFYVLKSGQWFWWAFCGIIISQVLIFYFWQDAKFGTIANVIILATAIVGFGSWNFENNYRADVNESLERTNNINPEIINENDLSHLPLPVQKYLRHAGVVGKSKIKNIKMVFAGEMRSKGEAWFEFTSEQFNFFDEHERLFFMKAKVKGLPTSGYHYFKNETAGMQVKLLSLFPVVYLKGEELFKAETVTVFNDLCLFAPAVLIDESIKWEAIDDFSAKAFFTNKGVRISATLFFNETGELINFNSDDRSALVDGELKNYRFSTPVKNYQDFNGYQLPAYGEAIWHYPDGEFIYGKFNIKSIEYNVSDIN